MRIKWPWSKPLTENEQINIMLKMNALSIKLSIHLAHLFGVKMQVVRREFFLINLRIFLRDYQNHGLRFEDMCERLLSEAKDAYTKNNQPNAEFKA